MTKAALSRVTRRVVGRGDDFVKAEENPKLRDDGASEVRAAVREQAAA